MRCLFLLGLKLIPICNRGPCRWSCANLENGRWYLVKNTTLRALIIIDWATGQLQAVWLAPGMFISHNPKAKNLKPISSAFQFGRDCYSIQQISANDVAIFYTPLFMYAVVKQIILVPHCWRFVMTTHWWSDKGPVIKKRFHMMTSSWWI